MSNKISSKKIMMVMVAILVPVYVIYQFVYININKSSVETEPAMNYTVSDTIDTKGTIIYDEQVITNPDGGVVSYKVSDGEKVAKDGVIAQVCSDEETVNAKMRIDFLNKSITDLTKIINDSKSMKIDETGLNDAIDASFIELMDNLSNKELVELRDVQNDLLMNFNRKQLLSGETAALEAELESLKAEKTALEDQYGDVTENKNITAVESGYFVSEVDGYENVLSVDSPSEITVELLETCSPEVVPDDVIGKIQTNEKFYIATVLTKEQALKIRKGDTVYLQIPLIDLNEIPVTVEEINHSTMSDKSSVVFGCTYQNKELALSRNVELKIILKEYTGLKISTEAIRTVDGKQGVYVLINNKVEFKSFDPEDIIYDGSGYILYKKAPIVEGETGRSEDQLLLYDQIIVDGKNIYEGKIIA